MPNNLSQNLIRQLFAQNSDDPYLALVTMTHPQLASPIYLCNNTRDIVSRGNTYVAFPFTLQLPTDDGESQREFAFAFDNVSLYLIEPLRTVRTAISLKLEMILASMPDTVQKVEDELEIVSIQYDQSKISAKVIRDNFLNTKLPSETYGPLNFAGIF